MLPEAAAPEGEALQERIARQRLSQFPHKEQIRAQPKWIAHTLSDRKERILRIGRLGGLTSDHFESYDTAALLRNRGRILPHSSGQLGNSNSERSAKAERREERGPGKRKIPHAAHSPADIAVQRSA